MQNITGRQAYLDWLRIMAIIGVLLFHSAMAFVAEDSWHIKNRETSHLLLEFNFWLSRFRMPLLFFISGTVSYFMLQKKSAGSFIAWRFRRLFVPLVAGMLIVVPPQVYLERLTQGFKGNYWDFYPSIFRGIPYPRGNLSWHHLWFIFYLFVYDILFAPVFAWLMTLRGRAALQKLNWVANGQWIYIITVPSIILYASLAWRFRATDDFINDWAYLPYWLLFVLGGFFCIVHPLLMNSLERNRRTSLTIAFLSIICINYFRWNNLEPWDVMTGWRGSWQIYAYMALYACTAWSWVFTAVGYGKRYLNKKLPVLQYANEIVYPFYILHQTVILVLVYYVVQIRETIGMKYAFTAIVSFLLTMAIVHLFVRPFALARFLFGMRPKKKAGAKEDDRIVPRVAKQEEATPAALPG